MSDIDESPFMDESDPIPENIEKKPKKKDKQLNKTDESEEERIKKIIDKLLIKKISEDNTGEETSKASENYYVTKLRKTELQMRFFRDEESGILGAFPGYKDTILTSIVAMAEPRLGILNLAKSYGKKEQPYRLIATVIIVLAVTYGLTTQPQLLTGLGEFFATKENQIFLVILSAIAATITYLVFRRRRRVIK